MCRGLMVPGPVGDQCQVAKTCKASEAELPSVLYIIKKIGCNSLRVTDRSCSESCLCTFNFDLLKVII